MLPNRFAWPPDLPMTTSCEPFAPVPLDWLTELPGLATVRASALVRRTVSFVVGLPVVKPPGPEAAPGNGFGLPPTMSLLPGCVPARGPTVVDAVSLMPGLIGRKPLGVVPGEF